MNELFLVLQEDFTGRIDGFLKSNENTITVVLFHAIYIIPILILVLGLELNRVNDECKATIKMFKMLPKRYLLKMKTSKYLMR